MKKVNKHSKNSATLKEAVQGRNKSVETTIFGIDIEHLKHNIDLLKYSLDYAEAIVNTVREPLVILNKELQVLTANKAFYKSFDLIPERLENRPFYELGNGELNIPRFKKLLQRVITQGMEFNDFEIEYDLPIIGKRTLCINARKFYRQINNTQTILLAIEDITDAKNAEKQKDEFASIIMHEIKGPVSTINGYVQLLEGHLSKRGDIKLLGYTQSMEVQVHRLTSLVNGLLNSSKIRAVGFEFRQDIFEIHSLITETISDVQQTSNTHQIIQESYIEKYVKGDRDRIAQVLTNLMINAIKYSPNASKILVSTSISEGKLIISVKDFGIGISKVNQKKVFDRFFRINNSNQETFYGVGLGLDISSQIVHHHKGKIWVNSTQGKGSMFNFSLPIHRA